MSTVSTAAADVARLTPEIDGWTENFLRLFDRVRKCDLVFEEAEDMSINWVGLCRWDDPTEILVIETIPSNQTTEQRKQILAKTSVIAALLRELGYVEIAVALLADDVGKIFRHEGLFGHCRTIRGCSRAPETPSQPDFSSIPNHSVVCPSVQRFSN
jgi:hypothetical protein